MSGRGVRAECGKSTHACAFIRIAEATASSVVDTCKAVVNQYGVGASSCPVTRDLAKANKNFAEDRCHETPRD